MTFEVLEFSPIHISPVTYHVEFNDRLTGESSNGVTSRERQVMELDPTLESDELAMTILHESYHCMFNQIPLLKEKLEDQVCEALAPRSLSFMRDNPKLMAFLVKSPRQGPIDKPRA